MNFLQQFASFIREQYFQNVIAKQEELLAGLNRPANTLLQEQLTSFLHFIQTGPTQETLKQEKQFSGPEEVLNSLSTFPATLSQSFQFITAQKQALLQHIPFYTKETTAAVELTLALEKEYEKIMVRLLQTFEDRQQEFSSQIQESEEHYKDLFDNAHDLIHIIKPEGTIMYVNNAWMNSLEYNADEIEGKLIYDFVDEHEKEKLKTYRENVLSGKVKDEEIVFSFRTKSGKKLTVEGFVSPRYENGKAISTRGIFRDVTARIQNEENVKFYTKQLAEREENLNKLVTHAPDAIIVADASGQITLWNPKAEEFFGWTSAEAIGRKLEETIIPPAYKEAHNAGMKRYLNTRESRILNQTIEITALHKTGREFPISLTISQSQQAGETVFISFSRDLSQQKKAELELQRQRKELDQSNRELEQYAWLTSHDLREPLRKILTFSDLILTRYPDGLREDVKNYIAKIQDAGNRMGNLIEAILQYSSITDNRNLFEQTNLNNVAQQVLADLEVAIKEAGAEIHLGPLPTVEASSIQMKQLLQNLIGNAIKYRSPERNPVISITSQNKSPNTIELQVKDNGRGFSMQDEKKVFGLFQRLNNDKNTRGTGVGLALCKKIVLNHGGNISVQSTPGEGSTFFVTLPIKQQS